MTNPPATPPSHPAIIFRPRDKKSKLVHKHKIEPSSWTSLYLFNELAKFRVH